MTTGDTFGKWTVVGDSQTVNRRRKVLCRCECGARVTVEARNLSNGASKSCGCDKAKHLVALAKARRMDLVGDVYGAWTVKAPSPTDREKWTCRCECGTVRDVAQSALRKGSSASCGCMREALMSAARKPVAGRAPPLRG